MFVGDDAFKSALDPADESIVGEERVRYAKPYPVLFLPRCIAGVTYHIEGRDMMRVQCYNATMAYNAKNGKKDSGSDVWHIPKYIENAEFKAEKMLVDLSEVRADMTHLIFNLAKNGLCPRTEIAMRTDYFSAAAISESLTKALMFLLPRVRPIGNETVVNYILPPLSLGLAVMAETIRAVPSAHILNDRLALYSSLSLSCDFLKGAQTGRYRTKAMGSWFAAYGVLGRIPLHVPPHRVTKELGFLETPSPGPVMATVGKSAQGELEHVIKRKKFYAQKLTGTCEVYVCAGRGCTAKFDSIDELHEHLGLEPTHNVAEYDTTQTVSVRSRVVAVLSTLDAAQRAAIVSYFNGNAVYLNAKAGTGKTRVLAALVKCLKIMCGAEWFERHVLNTAATGLSASINGATTLHAAGGFGVGRKEVTPQQLKDKCLSSSAADKVQQAICCIIDEWLLLPGIVGEALCLAIEELMKVANAHAAVQFFLCSDNKQLLCFDKRNEPAAVKQWCKISAMVPYLGVCAWRKRAEDAGCMYHELNICYRQLHEPIPEFPPLLELIRNGAWTLEMKQTLEGKVGKENPAEVVMLQHGHKTKEPEQFVQHPHGSVVLVMRNDRRRWYNEESLKNCNPNPAVYINALDGLDGADEANFNWAEEFNDRHFDNRPAKLQCKVDAPVRMLRKTKGTRLDGTGEFIVAPGTMGVIVGFINPESKADMWVVVDFVEDRGRPACRVKVGRVRFDISDDAPPVLVAKFDSRYQVPFDVAYAMTFSSAQGGEWRYIVLDFAGYGTGWLPHVMYLGTSRALYGPGLLCINLPFPRSGKAINAISPDMIALDRYFELMRLKEKTDQDETRVVTFDIISRLQVCVSFKLNHKREERFILLILHNGRTH